MDRHSRLVGMVNALYAAISLCGIGFSTLYFGHLVSGFTYPSLDLIPYAMLMTAILVAPSLLQLFVGIRHYRGSTWSRPWLIAIALLCLFRFPIGTALASYTLWALLKQSDRQLSPLDDIENKDAFLPQRGLSSELDAAICAAGLSENKAVKSLYIRQDQLKANLDQLNSATLMSKLQSGRITTEARAIITQLLAVRGITGFGAIAASSSGDRCFDLPPATTGFEHARPDNESTGTTVNRTLSARAAMKTGVRNKLVTDRIDNLKGGKMIKARVSIIDDIIKNWFPIMGILFVVAGMSYLFYEGIWQQLNETGRLTLGFLCGVAMISGSYPLEKSSKIIADSILAGGLLMLYVSLLFGSRFETNAQQAVIPELWALLIATLFTLGVVFFAYSRQSKYVLLIGILGGYLTPFFIGQGDQLSQFIHNAGVFQYNLPLIAFLIYFLAINMAILLVANRFFLKGIGLLNTMGLFIGTTTLFYFMGGQFPGNATQLALFSVAVFGLHISAMCVNAKKFARETDPYLIAGYLLPFAWYSAMLNLFIEPHLKQAAIAGLLAGSAIIYFAGWHYLRQVIDRQQHTALYLGGILAIVMAVIKLQPYVQHYDGLIFAAAALYVGVLYILHPVLQREMAFFCFAGFGLLMTFWHLAAINMPSLGFLSGQTICLSLAVSPFLLGGKFPQRDDEGESLKSFRELGYYLGIAAIAILVFLDLIQMKELPRSLLFLTIPAAITAYASYTADSDANRMTLIKLSLSLATAGFFSTLLTIIGRFYPFPSNIHLLASPECFVGAASLAVLFMLLMNLKRLTHADENKTNQAFGPTWQFFMVFSLYTILWATLTHEIMALFNSLNIDLESTTVRGLRSFATTIWWASLAGWMIFLGVRNSALENQKNIGFGLFALTIFKILFIDLQNINTNLKVFVFLVVGGLMLAISYVANKRGQDEAEM